MEYFLFKIAQCRQPINVINKYSFHLTFQLHICQEELWSALSKWHFAVKKKTNVLICLKVTSFFFSGNLALKSRSAAFWYSAGIQLLKWKPSSIKCNHCCPLYHIIHLFQNLAELKYVKKIDALCPSNTIKMMCKMLLTSILAPAKGKTESRISAEVLTKMTFALSRKICAESRRAIRVWKAWVKTFLSWATSVLQYLSSNIQRRSIFFFFKQ